MNVIELLRKATERLGANRARNGRRLTAHGLCFPEHPLVVAAFSRHGDALTWAARHLQTAYGPVAAVSPAFAFNQTSYYEASMGPDLHKQFLAFERLASDPERPRGIRHAAGGLSAPSRHCREIRASRPP